jgi:hypothetical protein
MLCEVRVVFAVVVLDTVGAVGAVCSHNNVIFLKSGVELKGS